MSSQIKLSLLALVSTAAAIPHYGHQSFHSRPSAGNRGPGTGAPYPTGGWGGNNSTRLPLPTGTGAYPSDEKTTTLVETQYSTETVVSTIYATRSRADGSGEAPSSVGAVDLSTGAAGVCGPETIYVTATNQVTVTVPAGGVPSSINTPPSSVAEPTSEIPEVPAASTPGGGYGVPIPSETFAFPESSAAAEEPSSKASEPAPVPTPDEVYTSEAPVETPAPSEAPASSAAPESSTPVSSDTPAPSSPPSGGYSGTKRGLAYNDAELCKSFSTSNFGWLYNWGSTESNDLGAMFVPTCHKPATITVEQWTEDVNTAVEKGSNVIMGFNEPDHSAQANMPPEVACTEWQKYMDPQKQAHPELTIVGPSVTNGPAPMGLAYLEEFMKYCSSSPIDITNVHFYDQYDAEVLTRFKTQVQKAHDMFSKPVWVTEFGLNPGTATQEQAAEFLKGAQEFLDSAEFVTGYAYFMVGTGENQLNSANGLSAVGQVYASS